MAKTDFRVTSTFKIVIRICMKNVESCRKASNLLPKRFLFIFCIFHLNEKELKHSSTSKTFLKLKNLPELQ